MSADDDWTPLNPVPLDPLDPLPLDPLLFNRSVDRTVVISLRGMTKKRMEVTKEVET